MAEVFRHMHAVIGAYYLLFIPFWYRYVVLIIDEMKIRDDLVYDRSGSHLLGFVSLGDVNNQLLELEQQVLGDKPHDHIATQMLTLMVRGIFIKLEFPYASFPTQGIILFSYLECNRYVYTLFHRCHRRNAVLGDVGSCPSAGRM